MLDWDINKNRLEHERLIDNDQFPGNLQFP